MSPLEREVILRKLERITVNLRLLQPFRGLEEDAYRGDVYRRKAAERLLQEIVEAAVDINAHILVGEGSEAPVDLFSSFLDMGDLGALDPALARELAPSAGLRNRLVHEYDVIDDAIILSAIDSAFTSYPRYVASVERYLDRR